MNAGALKFVTGAVTHQGCRRDHNEDRYLAKPEAGVWLVADGMGGHAAGDFASQTIVECVTSVGRPSSAPDLQARFQERIGTAHELIQRRAAELNGTTIGATLVALLVYDAHFACVWSGDSRVYLLRDGAIQQVSVDHTEVQELLASGAITPAQAENWPRKNVITRAIGVSPSPRTDERYGVLRQGDVFLLCSDGLTEHVTDPEIAAAMAMPAPQAACEQLLEMTLERGAVDNVTVVMVQAHAAGAAAELEMTAEPEEPPRGIRREITDIWKLDD